MRARAALFYRLGMPRTARKLRLLLVDGHLVFRQALARVLAAEECVASVHGAGTFDEAISAPVRADVCLLEVDLSDASGLDLIPELTARHPGISIILLTACRDQVTLARAVEAGAAGVIGKEAGLDDILLAVRRIADGHKLLDWPAMVEMIRLARAHDRQNAEVRARARSLTARELEVLGALAAGLSDKEVASTLRISVVTVRSHLVNVFGKLQVESRLQAVLFALRHGLADLA
jgi:DNA-binding NarL/FixJ family response regulator